MNLIAQAKLRGLTEDEAKSFGTPDALMAALNGTPSTQPDDSTGQDTGQSDAGDELGLDPQEYGDEVVDAFKKMQDKIKSLEEKVAEPPAAPQGSADHEAILQTFDSAVAGLGEDYAGVFGNGSWKDIPQGSTEDNNRAALAQAMDKVAVKRAAVGESTQDVKAIAEEAIRDYFPDLHKKVLQGTVSRKVNQRAKQAIHRPSGTHLDPDLDIDPEERATRSVAQLLKKLGQ